MNGCEQSSSNKVLCWAIFSAQNPKFGLVWPKEEQSGGTLDILINAFIMQQVRLV